MTAPLTLSAPPGETVVEMGCGMGANLPGFRERVGPAGRVVGLNFAPGALAVARDRTARWDNVAVVRANACHPSVRRADRALATFVVELLGDPAAAIETWVTLISPGGRLAPLDVARRTRPATRPLNLGLDACRALLAARDPGADGRSDSRARPTSRRGPAHGTQPDDTRVKERYAAGFAQLVAGEV